MENTGSTFGGDLHTPLESLALDCNGLTIESGISAKHIIGRNAPESTGLYQRLSFTANVTERKIELCFYGDETQFLRDKDRYDQWVSPERKTCVLPAQVLGSRTALEVRPQRTIHSKQRLGNPNRVISEPIDSVERWVFDGHNSYLPPTENVC